MKNHEDPKARRTHALLVGAGALAGAAAAMLLGAAVSQAPRAAPAPAAPPRPTPAEVTARTDAAMKALDRFVGRWDVRGQSFDENDKPVGDFTGSAHYSWAMSDNFLVGETTLTNGSKVLDQVDYFGYSPGLGKYTHVMLTELDKSMIYQHGAWMEEVGSFVFAMAAPLDTPRGTPRSVGLEYGFSDAGIAVTMTMQSGTRPARKVRMLLTPSAQPAAQVGPDGMPAGGNVRVQYRQGDPAAMRTEMQQAMSQMTAQKQAMAQYVRQMNMGWDGEMDKMMDKELDRGVDERTQELFRSPE